MCHERDRTAYLRSGAVERLAGFTSGATEAAAKAYFRIVLIDGDQLAEYMIDNGVGVTDYKTYTVKKLDGDYIEGV